MRRVRLAGLRLLRGPYQQFSTFWAGREPQLGRIGETDGVALREIADETQIASVLRERMIESYQTQIEVDEPEEDQMALLMSGEMDRPMQDDMSEEKLLRALMEAQGDN